MTTSPDFIKYLYHLGDNALILGHRLSEWCGHGPEMETDLALTNIALDLTGQARNIYQQIALLEAQGKSEDDIAFLRDVWHFRNLLIVELPKGDFAVTVARQFFIDNWNNLLFNLLIHSKDEWLSGLAGKSVKEVTYHLRFSREWMLRLGDGTEESNQKLQDAVNQLWPYIGEFSTPAEFEIFVHNNQLGPNPENLREDFENRISTVLKEANLVIPKGVFMQQGGKEGRHTEHLGYMLAEMQFLQRAYPGLEW